MEVCSKIAKITDTTVRFELPTKTLQHISFPPDECSVELPFTDRSGRRWTCHCCKRRDGRHPKPSLRRGWLQFVRSKGVRVGDRVIIRKLDGGEFEMEVKRETNIKLFGRNMWVHVEDAHLHGVA